MFLNNLGAHSSFLSCFGEVVKTAVACATEHSIQFLYH